MIIQKVGDILYFSEGSFEFQKLGDLNRAVNGGAMFESVGVLSKFTFTGKCKSRRSFRVKCKKLVDL